MTDLIKVIASTEQFDARSLTQPALRTAVRQLTARSSVDVQDNLLDQMLFRAGTRKIGLPRTAGGGRDWQAVTTVVTVERTGPGTSIGEGGTTVGGGIEVVAPAGFSGIARVTALPSAARDLGRSPVPPVLRECADPFELVTTRGTTNLSVLEI